MSPASETEPVELHQKAFIALHERMDGRLFAYLRRRMRDPDAAAELGAECWAAAFAGWRRCRATCDAEAEAWVFGIARHQLGRYYRNGSIERRAVERLALITAPSGGALDEELERVADRDALSETIANMMLTLPPMRRRAVRLRIVHGLDYDEAAARLGCSEQAARAHVSRGLRQLADVLNRDGSRAAEVW
jgi:RNA polymerase sigma factor (sigma-70 family)